MQLNIKLTKIFSIKIPDVKVQNLIVQNYCKAIYNI